MEADDLYTRAIQEELAALRALSARIKAKPYLDQLQNQLVQIKRVSSLVASLDNPKEGRKLANQALRASLLLREQIHQRLKKHGPSLGAGD
jgi:hypothetical protein